jgi:adenosylcobinamide kinase / adenosylcobinamide-phosphate guanylyltransferase
MARLILVTGPARSGKSEWAESLAIASGKLVVYTATAQIDISDWEWQARIDRHQSRRPASWKLLEVPIDLAPAIRGAIASECLLIDSLGTWVANLLAVNDDSWENIVRDLLESLLQTSAEAILVAEETGWGVVPAYQSGRSFRDRLGNLVRQVGAIANPVYLVTGGHVLNLSQLGSPLPS